MAGCAAAFTARLRTCRRLASYQVMRLPKYSGKPSKPPADNEISTEASSAINSILTVVSSL